MPTCSATGAIDSRPRSFFRPRGLSVMFLAYYMTALINAESGVGDKEKGYNCLRRDTRFIPANGVKSFEDFNDGDQVRVLTHKGRFMAATVRKYGVQKLYPIRI